MNTPSQILRNINSEKFKGFDALDNNSACTDGAPGATIIIKKVNRHGFTFGWIKAHVVVVRKARDIIHNTIQIQFKYDGEFLVFFHVLTRSLTITENSTGPSLLPWGIPSFRERILEESEPMRTDCERPWRKAAIHLTR